MRNKILFGAVILVALFASGYVLLSTPKEAVAPEVKQNAPTAEAVRKEAPAPHTAPKKHEITYTADGFAPAVLNIAVGDIVTFANKSRAAFWPASNEHPIHTAYSEFDAKMEISAGQTYEFTFMKSGEWGYHDHLNPKMMGVIIVK